MVGRHGKEHPCENTRSASPVFPQLGLEPNHAGLASQSLFLLEELLQSKTQWHSKNILKLLELFKKSSEPSQTSSKVLQIKRLQLKLKITNQTPTKSSQNNMFLRHGSNNIQKHQKPTKNEKSPSKLFHAQTGSIWFQIGSYVVPTWFLRFSIVQMGCSYKLKSHLLVLMHMQCSKIGFKKLQVGSRC